MGVDVRVTKRVGAVVAVENGIGVSKVKDVGTIGVRFNVNGVAVGVSVNTISVTIKDGSVKARLVTLIGVRVGLLGVAVARTLPPLE